MNIVIPSGADADNAMPQDARNSLERRRSVLNFGRIQASVEGLLEREDACVRDSVRKNLPCLDGDNDGVVTSDEVAVAFVQTARDAVNQALANAARERAQEHEAARMAKTNKHLTWFAGALVFVCVALAGTTFLTGWAAASLAQPTKASTDGALVSKKDGRELSTHTAVDTFVLRQPDPQELERRRLACTQATADDAAEEGVISLNGSSQTDCDVMSGSPLLSGYTLMGNYAETLIEDCRKGHSVKVTVPWSGSFAGEYQICGNCMPHMYAVNYGLTFLHPRTDGQVEVPKLQTIGEHDGFLTVEPQYNEVFFSDDGEVDLSQTVYTLTGSIVCPPKCMLGTLAGPNACMNDSSKAQASVLVFIGCASCNGDHSCGNPPEESSKAIGHGSCNKKYSCRKRNGFSIGNNSCNGIYACYNLEADVPDGACNSESQSTYEVDGGTSYNCYNNPPSK